MRPHRLWPIGINGSRALGRRDPLQLEVIGASRNRHEVAQGQETTGGTTSLIMTTSQSACRAVGPMARSRLASNATMANPAATRVVSAIHSSIGVSSHSVGNAVTRY